MIEFYASSSEIVNSKKAIEVCLKDALGENNLDRCNLIVVYSSIGHQFSTILEGAKNFCPNATITGGTGGGIIGNNGASEKMRTLAVMAMVCGKNEIAVVCQDQIQGSNSYEIGKSVAQKLYNENSNINYINVLASGIDIAADKILAGIETVFGKEIKIFGGTSADNMKLKNNYQFHDDTILERGIVLIGYADPTLDLITCVSHGSKPIGNEFTVTACKDNEVISLDGAPGWPSLMNALKLPENTEAAEALVLSAMGEEISEELKNEYGSAHKLHTIFKVSDDKQSFFLPVACKPDTKFTLVQRDENLIFSGTEKMMQGLINKINGKTPVAIFHTDCLARGRLMFNKIEKEEFISILQKPFDKSVPWLGLYGFGEFTPLAGENHFHTQTSSLYVFVR